MDRWDVRSTLEQYETCVVVSEKLCQLGTISVSVGLVEQAPISDMVANIWQTVHTNIIQCPGVCTYTAVLNRACACLHFVYKPTRLYRYSMHTATLVVTHARAYLLAKARLRLPINEAPIAIRNYAPQIQLDNIYNPSMFRLLMFEL